MSMTAIKRVNLAAHHLSPGKTQHTFCDENGARPFPPFTSLEIAQYPGDSGYYLLHLCDGGLGTDTWHQTLEEALHQAEWEFGVLSSEWVDILE